jgi:hypothetical protein
VNIKEKFQMSIKNIELLTGERPDRHVTTAATCDTCANQVITRPNPGLKVLSCKANLHENKDFKSGLEKASGQCRRYIEKVKES